MNFRAFGRLGLLSLALAASVAILPAAAQAESIRVMRGAAASALQVPMNRAVVVESDTPFTELSIANPGIADISTLSDRSIYVLGKTPGRTTLSLFTGEGRLISNVEVHVTPDIAEFKERLRQILPTEKIEVRTANDGIVLSGTVSSTAKLDRALDLANRYAPDRVSNMMNVGGTQQVMLKVRFAEMQRSVSKSLTSQIGANGVIGRGSGATQVGASSMPGNSGSIGQLGMGFSVGSMQFAVMLEALENKGVVRTLAEPNLTALSGQEAKFLAGGEYPIPVRDEQGVKVEYKPFGVQLAFTPRVIDGDVINLEINAAVSSIDSSIAVLSEGISVNGFKRRETSSTVEMRDGESFAIAGLLQDDFSNMKGQVPWLGDIPVLGALFRSADYQRQQSELVIIVTPHLVTPTRGEALALPTDRVRLPSESEFFLGGKNLGAPRSGAAGEIARQDFNSPYGYVME